MTDPSAVKVEQLFAEYRRANVSLGFPAVSSLSDRLNREAQSARSSNRTEFQGDRALARLFASAAIEMWHRAVHSFLISSALTETSAIWAAVAGYYASHYVVRGHAHLLGRFLLYRHKQVAALGLRNGSFVCTLLRKGGSYREHKAYWKMVRESAEFSGDPFFSTDSEAIPLSDGAHRNKANYADHLANFASIKLSTSNEVVRRIQRIAEIELSSVPLPSSDRYPDLENVQVIAYHRIVRFRSFLDELLGDTNKFWNAHRQPNWCNAFIDFQIIAPDFVPTIGAT